MTLAKRHDGTSVSEGITRYEDIATLLVSRWRKVQRSQSRERRMKIASFNINNIRKRLPNLLEWLRRAKPDVACLQE